MKYNKTEWNKVYETNGSMYMYKDELNLKSFLFQ